MTCLGRDHHCDELITTLLLLLLLLLLLQPVPRPTVMTGCARLAAALLACVATQTWRKAQHALTAQ
jgi:hypothetical protein